MNTRAASWGRLEQGLVAAVAVLLVAALFAAALIPGGEGDAVVTSANGPTSTTVPDTAAPGEPAPGDTAPGATPAPGGPAPDQPATGAAAAPGGSAAAAPAGPNLPFQPPRDGTYHMTGRSETSSGGTKQSQPLNATFTIETVERTSSHIRQRRDAEGNGGGQSFAADGESTWRADGIFGSMNPNAGAQMQMSCEPKEQVEMKFPLAPGATWKNVADCKMSGARGGEGTFHVEQTTVVVGKKTIQVAGQTVEVWELMTDGTNSGSFTYQGKQQQIDGENHMVSYLAESVGMVVRATGSGKQKSSGFSFENTFEMELTNLTPQ